MSVYIKPILNEEYVKNNKLWYPSEHIFFFAFNNIFSAIFDVVLPFNDPFITKYGRWSDRMVQASGMSFFFDIITNFKIRHWKWAKHQISWDTANEGDIMLIDWMRNNGYTVDPERNILHRNQAKNDNGLPKANKVYIDFLIAELEKKEINVHEILSDVHNNGRN